MLQPGKSEGTSPATRLVAAAALTNFSMGLLYCWALFAAPVADELGVQRSAVAAVPALALVAFTIGVNLYRPLAHRIGAQRSAMLVFGCAVLGLGLVAAFPSLPVTFIGFGAIFGIASGLGYGQAFALANITPPAVRSFSIGVCMTSFALTAIVLTFVVDTLLERFGLQATFVVLAAGIACLGLLVVLLLRMPLGENASFASQSGGAATFPLELYPVAIAFFVFCFAGLAVMANSSLLLRDFNVAPSLANKAVAVFNGAYLVGSLCGAKATELVGGKRIVAAALAVQFAAILFAVLSNEPGALWLLTGVLGCLLGGTASVFPVYLAQIAEARLSAVLFPRLIIFYGIAGLTAPITFAFVREYSGDNIVSFWLLLFMTSVSLAVLLRASGERYPSAGP